MGNPVGGSHEGHTLADTRHCEIDAVFGPTICDLLTSRTNDLRGFVGGRQCGVRSWSTTQMYPINSHWPPDVLELLLADVDELGRHLALDLPMGILGQTNAAGLGKTLQPCRHVHAIPENVTTIEHDIPDIDADAKLDPLLLRHIRVALGHSPLDIKGTTHRVHNAAELGQQPVAGVLDNSPTVLSNLGVDEGAQVILELGVRSL